MKRVLLFGASGSIGSSTLAVLRGHRERFRLAGLQVHRRTEALADWIAEFAPERVAVTDPVARRNWADAHPDHAARLLPEDAPAAALLDTPADVALNGILGFAGLAVTLAALERGVDLALANKESLVCGGDLVLARRRASGARLLPVDSEHAALFQILAGRPASQVRRVWLTASGGPFLGRRPEELADVTPAEALRHPTWRMGPKITVDSATMMNKGFEIIEAARLFDLPAERIAVLVDPDSRAHALVEFTDSSVLCQLAAPDMRQPIAQALAWPERVTADYGRLDLAAPLRLELAPLDGERFPAVDLAREALRRGGTAPLALNAADEVAVGAFLDGHLPFSAIVTVAAETLTDDPWPPAWTLEELVGADRRARDLAAARIAARRTAAH
ncbi:MAG: 1-deoxy-D-xylulose-5-phosphate reductoisomerase [Candidatus Krumholzibacteriota bacterium]|nr:1-deoxy-D-xylulose-5-phosphate reductoisomerase [Candidatus Krumholzibacteriota bacterium]